MAFPQIFRIVFTLANGRIRNQNQFEYIELNLAYPGEACTLLVRLKQKFLCARRDEAEIFAKSAWLQKQSLQTLASCVLRSHKKHLGLYTPREYNPVLGGEGDICNPPPPPLTLGEGGLLQDPIRPLRIPTCNFRILAVLGRSLQLLPICSVVILLLFRSFKDPIDILRQMCLQIILNATATLRPILTLRAP